jgi:hypothetical protein
MPKKHGYIPEEHIYKMDERGYMMHDFSDRVTFDAQV